MKFAKIILAFVPRLLIALPLFVVIVCATVCAGLVEMLSGSADSRVPSVDAMTSSFNRG